MKKSRFSDEEKIAILKEVRAGSTVVATYHGWRRKFGSMEVDEARRLRALEEENGRLKRVVADLTVQVQILKEVNAKKW